MKKKTLYVGVAVALAAALSLSGCAGSGSASSNVTASPVAGGDLQVAWNAQPLTLDPVATTGYTTRDIANNIFEGLIALDAKSAVQPMLAESWKVSDDQKTFTFTLRKNVHFHNGAVMTANDVVASLNRWIAVSSMGKNFTGSTVSALDDNTVQIMTPKPLGTALDLLARPTQPMVVMPASVIASADPKTGVKDLIGTGPYKFVEWKKDQYIKLEKFADYDSLSTPSSGLAGAKKPMLDTITYNIVTDAATRVSGVQTGQYDVAVQIPSDSVPQVQSDPSIVVNTASTSFDGLVFNKKQGPLADQKLRQAIMTALDDKAILTASRTNSKFFTLNGALNSPSQKAWYTDSSTDAYNQHDVTKAKQLLAQSGYHGEKITFLTTRDYPFMYSAGVVITQELKDLGLNVDMQVVDWASVLAAQSNPAAFDMFLTYFSLGAPSTYAFLGPDWAGWTNSPEIQSALNQISVAGDEKTMRSAYDALQKAYFDYVPIVKLGDFSDVTLMKKSVGNFGTLVGPILYNSYIAK